MRQKSVYWKYFDKNDDGTATCRVCFKKVKTSGNTSNLNCHIVNAHPNVFREQVKTASKEKERYCSNLKQPDCIISFIDVGDTTNNIPTQPGRSASTSSESKRSEYLSIPAFKRQKTTVTEPFREVVTYGEGENYFNKVTNSILYMICKDSQPFSIVENKGFKQVIKCTAPYYKIPSRCTIKRHFNTKYELISDMFKKKLSTINYCSLTTNIWTDTMENQSFLEIAVHFIDMESMNFVSATLDAYELSEFHTSEYIAEKILSTCKNWNISDEKVTAIVTNSGPNLLKAAEIAFGNKRHIICFAHTLNLVVENAIGSVEELGTLIKKVKSIVAWFKNSVVAIDELKKATNAPTKLFEHFPTRWISTFYIIERFLELRVVINDIVNRHKMSPPMVTALELEILNEICIVLRPFEAAIREICEEPYLTTSLVIPMVNCLTQKISNLSPVHEIAINLKNMILNECKKQLESAEHVDVLSVATLLDPRFKKIHFQNPVTCSRAIHILKESVKDIISNPEITSNFDHTVTSTKNEKYSLWSDHHKLVREIWDSNTPQTNENDVPSEVDLYLRAPPVGLMGDKPLKIWEELAGTYPNLYRLILKYMSSVATSMPSERLFTKSGMILTQQRNRLKERTLSEVTFLQSVDDRMWDL